MSTSTTKRGKNSSKGFKRKTIRKGSAGSPEWAIVVGLDPGGTTGIAVGLFDLSLGSVRKCMRAGFVRTGSVAHEDPVVHAILAHQWIRSAIWELRADPRWVGQLVHVLPEFACEDFILRGGRVGTTARDGLAPVRVGVALETLAKTQWGVSGDRWKYQMPSQAKTFVTDERLKLWKLYTVSGSAKPHRRDALRHVGLRLSSLLDRRNR